ncbi:MAG: GNAT family acetyltransferase [Fibrobacter sp.]|nr:GNAT family acetyltransferase [Fibrobacter sp.]
MNDTFKIRTYNSEDEKAVIEIWRQCNLLTAANNPVQDIKRKCEEDRDLFSIGELKGQVISTCMAGFDGHRGWIYYLTVLPIFQGNGFGKLLVRNAEDSLKNRGCPKIDLMVRSTNLKVIEFYNKIGFSQESVTVMGKRLIVDEEYKN